MTRVRDQKGDRSAFGSGAHAPNRRHRGGEPLSRRGRVTLLALAGAVGLVVTISLVFFTLGISFDFSSSDVSVSKGGVAAGPRVAGSGSANSSRPRAPEPLYSRLPVGTGHAVYSYADEPSGSKSSGVAFESSSSDPFTHPRLVEVVPAPMEPGALCRSD